jgi:hypothetical protein
MQLNEEESELCCVCQIFLMSNSIRSNGLKTTQLFVKDIPHLSDFINDCL